MRQSVGITSAVRTGLTTLTRLFRVSTSGVEMPGKKYASIKHPKVYEALRRKGYSKRKAAKISNAGRKGRRKGKR